MKRLLSIIGAITLLGTSTTSLVACNAPQEYTSEELTKLKENNKIDTADENIKNNLEWIAPQEKPFNEVDNKYYYVVWRGDENDNWRLIKHKNNTLDFIEIDNFEKADLWKSSPYKFGSGQTLNIAWTFKEIYWENDNGTYFKYVYRWNLDTQEPNLDIDKDGNVKVKEK
ncbi:lipoprotein [Spiroplasma phoeniceum]|uniref:Lipoprotein n=1 Tax=Spiroplasma phoeniceum P40 TaxID=1276259 RepID=A0A345DP08_9MOLU|nr:lipoprotein [Spiroplasma phoeniceum]AXF95946.1 putative lipoprotein [Spiroplasma phoeniceum P40]